MISLHTCTMRKNIVSQNRVVLLQGFISFRYGKKVFVKCIYFLLCNFEMYFNRFTKWYAVMVLFPTIKRSGPIIYKQQLTAYQFSHWKCIELYANKQIKHRSWIQEKTAVFRQRTSHNTKAGACGNPRHWMDVHTCPVPNFIFNLSLT